MSYYEPNSLSFALMSNLSNKMNNELVPFLKVKSLLQIPQRDCRQIFAIKKNPSLLPFSHDAVSHEGVSHTEVDI